jgi:hypothetical protein
VAPPACKGFLFGEFWPHLMLGWAQLALPRSLPAFAASEEQVNVERPQ